LLKSVESETTICILLVTEMRVYVAILLLSVASISAMNVIGAV